ncbi:hypothetical protein BC830DRAFT_1201115 [Chytriomyces sp. MP71]|nr:hypothetical protein BC830DRAFT_1201115 [Chytriomyces sp. MP71]
MSALALNRRPSVAHAKTNHAVEDLDTSSTIIEYEDMKVHGCNVDLAMELDNMRSQLSVVPDLQNKIFGLSVEVNSLKARQEINHSNRNNFSEKTVDSETDTKVSMAIAMRKGTHITPHKGEDNRLITHSSIEDQEDGLMPGEVSTMHISNPLHNAEPNLVHLYRKLQKPEKMSNIPIVPNTSIYQVVNLHLQCVQMPGINLAEMQEVREEVQAQGVSYLIIKSTVVKPKLKLRVSVIHVREVNSDKWVPHEHLQCVFAWSVAEAVRHLHTSTSTMMNAAASSFRMILHESWWGRRAAWRMC